MQQRPFTFCPGPYYIRLVDELRPLTYEQVGQEDQAVVKGRVDNDPRPFPPMSRTR